jgi:hypothetical protein
MWKTQIPIVSKVEKNGKMHKSIKKHVIKSNDRGWKGGAQLHNVWALHEMNDGIKGLQVITCNIQCCQKSTA